MATSEQIKTALLTEHFRYTPLTLLDDIVNTVNELTYQAVGEIETALLNVPKEQLGFAPTAPHSTSDQTRDTTSQNTAADTVAAAEATAEEAATTEISAGIVKLESLLNSTIDKNFDKLEIYTLRNLLTVSNAKEDEGLENWILLDHYKDLKTPSTDGNTPTPDSITRLRRKVQETEKLQSSLQAEVAQNEALLAQLRSLVPSATATSSKPDDDAQQHATNHSFSFLTSTSAAASLGVGSTSHANSLAQNTSFVYSQLPALRDIVATLRAHLATLPKKDMAATIDGVQEARHGYIESQSRRALERVGVDATPAPDTEALGRRMGVEETRALEGIVGAMGAQQKYDEDKMEE
ncbi:hypothetical protein M436DRAFT_76971 [Aureobasidium namibiae CBS 147.97]|uniref:MIND kinetochore complex component Mtw1 n=1 Tax=Aureobasidium namibiae CBS 147.97 TaxID=1043004 RepID=A0A074W9N7_9PEZI